MSDLDFLRLDRDLRLTVRRWQTFQRDLRNGEEAFDPFEATRWVSTRETFLAASSAPDDPVLAAARRWIYRLAEQRINQYTLLQIERGYRSTPFVFDEPEHNRLSLQQIFHQILLDDPRRLSWVHTFARLSGDLSAAHLRVWERRREVAIRMGLTSPTEIEGCCPDLEKHAEDWLNVTQRIWEVFRKPRYSEYVNATLGKKADAGWPVRLTSDALLDWFRKGHLFTSLNLDPGPLPRAYGASSYLRGMARLGSAWVDATAPTNQPFVIAHDPYGLKRRTYGAMFGLLLSTPAFLQQTLSLGKRDIHVHRQVLGLTLLAYSRAAALRILLRPLAQQGPRVLGSKIEDLTFHTLGFPLKLQNFGASLRLNVDDAQRFSGLFLGHTRLMQMIETHNDDFFRNPKAIDQLRSEAPRMPETETTSEAIEAGAAQLERWISDALD